MTQEAVIPYGRHAVDEDDVAAVVRVLRGDWLTQGPAVAEFEAALCNALGAPEAVAVNSGTAALHLGMAALGIQPRDVVVVPAITFVASANAALYCGADVALCDVEPDSGLLSVDALEELVTAWRGPGQLRAVVAVHYAGLPCDMPRLTALCKKHGLALVEDACHALGAEWTTPDGSPTVVGASGDSAFAAFSFHPVKHVTTAEGGAVVTGDAALAKRVRVLRTHGITRDRAALEQDPGPWWYEMQSLGFNYRLPDVLAALGTSQLRKHSRWLARRREIAAHYRRELAGLPGIAVQAERVGRLHAYHLFPIQAERRTALFTALMEHGIRPQVHYIPIHQQPYYRHRYGAVHLPGADGWYAREVSLPMYGTLGDEGVERVCTVVREHAVT